MPEIIDPVFAKTSQNARFLLSENERFGLVFVKTGSINSGTGNVTDALPFSKQFLDPDFPSKIGRQRYGPLLYFRYSRQVQPNRYC